MLHEDIAGEGTDARVDELLDQYEGLRAQGQEVSVEELCRDCPTLAPAVRRGIQTLEVIDGGLDSTTARSFRDTTPAAEERPPYPTTPVKRPQQLGRYRIDKLLGQGGFGQVWSGYDPDLQRAVAIKITRPDCLAGPSQTKSFRREAQKVAQLKHPGIVPVHDFGCDGPSLFIVSDLIEGVTLAEKIRRHCPAHDESVEIVKAVAEALHYAHQHGIMHRDVKPNNILLDAAGAPHVTDFGIAKYLTGDATTVESGCPGTVPYMSPEQVRGYSDHVDARTDVYSLGVVLFELLTGRLPFRGNQFALIRQIGEDAPPSPRELDSSIPRDIETICLKCLEKLPERRYQSAQEMADELERYRRGEPVLARPLGPLYGLAFSPDSRVLATCDGAGIIRLRSVETGQVLATQAGHTSVVWSVAYSPDGAWLATGSVNKTVKVWNASLGQCLQSLKGHKGAIYSVAFAPAGSTLVSGSQDGTIKIWDPSSGQILATLQASELAINSVAFSPEPDTLVSGGDDKLLRLWDLQTGKVLHAMQGHTEEIVCVAFSPNGRYLASGGVDQTVRLWNARTGELLMTLAGHDNYIASVAFHPDSATLASASADGTTRLWDVATGGLKGILYGHAGVVQGVAYMPNGEFLATAGLGDRRIKFWDAATSRPRAAPSEMMIGGQAQPVLTGHSEAVRALAFMPDGKRLVSAGADGLVILWDCVRGQAMARLPQQSTPIRSVAVSRDGTSVIAACGEYVWLWELQSGELIRKLGSQAGRVCSVACAPDNRLLASGNQDGSTCLWDMRTGELLATLHGHEDDIRSIVFAPNGKTLATASEDRTVRIWDAASYRELHLLRGHTDIVSALAYSPDCKHLVSTSMDLTAVLWDVATGRSCAVLGGHADAITCVAFSPDGKTLATGSWDRSVKLWDSVSRKEHATLRAHSRKILCLAFAPDGKTLATGSADKTIRLSFCSPNNLEQ